MNTTAQGGHDDGASVWMWVWEVGWGVVFWGGAQGQYCAFDAFVGKGAGGSAEQPAGVLLLPLAGVCGGVMRGPASPCAVVFIVAWT